MAKIISEEKDIAIRSACKIFGVRGTCYRYKRKLSPEDDIIAGCLMHLVGDPKNWGFAFYIYVISRVLDGAINVYIGYIRN